MTIANGSQEEMGKSVMVILQKSMSWNNFASLEELKKATTTLSRIADRATKKC